MNDPTPDELAAQLAAAAKANPPEMTPEQIVATVDQDDENLPGLRYQPMPMFWKFENFVDANGEAGIVMQLSNMAIPFGIPWCISRDRGMLFCSQLKKRLQTGPQLAVPANVEAPSGLILPGR